MSNTTTNTNEWITIKIERALSNQIDATISQVKRYGARKYLSKAEFVTEACIRLLEQEKAKEVVVSK
jgi:hypothetical protein